MKEDQKRLAGTAAAQKVKSGMTVSLGTGSTAYYVVMELARRVKEEGLRIRCVSTSEATAKIARENGIEILDLNEVEHIDIALDGVDEIQPDFRSIKGGGGALLREKIAAGLSDEVWWVMDASKPVEVLGAFPLPVEVVTYGLDRIKNKLEALGYNPTLRTKDGQPFVTDQGNRILDLHLPSGVHPFDVAEKILLWPGVVETGCFAPICRGIFIGRDDGVEVRENPNPTRYF